MWIGERITEKGVGNGISIVLVINIISRIPSDMKTLFDQFVKGKAIASACLAVCVIIAIISLRGCIYRNPAGWRKKNCCTVFPESSWKKILWWSVYKHSVEG